MNKRITVVFLAMFLILISLACTIPVYIGTPPESETEPEEKIVYIEITSTPEDMADTSAADASEEVVSATPTVSVNLDGPWTIWQGTSGQQLMIDFLQQGYDLIGNAATGDSHSMLFKGVIAQDGTSVTGIWESTNGTSGNFSITMNQALTSFSGNLGGGVQFCGTRMGSARPSPCLK